LPNALLEVKAIITTLPLSLTSTSILF